MAYVAISKDLIERVRSNIDSMRNAEITSSCPTLGRTFSMDASHLFNLGCWGEHLHLMQVIPQEWLHPQELADIYVAGDHEVDGETHRVRRSVRFGGLTTAYAKPSKSGGYWGDNKSEFVIDDLRALPDGTVGRAELIARYEESCVEKEIEVRWNKIKADMTEFLHKCKSLNEAVKLFPGVKMYVGRDDIARMERKIERAPRQELVANIDTGTMTAAAVAARLMGAA